jgi:hypothetical protein
MSESPLSRAQRRTREALHAVPPPAEAGPLQPGDLVVLPRTAGFPVEWAVLDRAIAPHRLWLVPADTHPLQGHGDVEIPAGEPGGPLWLRCRFATWVSADPEPEGTQRTGRLAPLWIQEAKDRCGTLARGTRLVSSLADEAEADPEYQDWERQVLEPARFALEERHAETVPVRRERRRPGSSSQLWQGLAAACFLATVGLSVWVIELRQRLDRPAIDLISGEVLFDGPSRSGEVPSQLIDAPQPPALTARIPDQQLESGAVYLLEVRDPAGRSLETSSPFQRVGDDILVNVAFRQPISLTRTYRFLLLRQKGERWVVEDERIIHFATHSR